jgi:hypothetical protein
MNAIQERAKKLVDETAARFDPRKTSSHQLGLEIVKKVQQTAPGDRVLLDAVVAYMQHLAAGSCGPDANHDCAWRSA